MLKEIGQPCHREQVDVHFRWERVSSECFGSLSLCVCCRLVFTSDHNLCSCMAFLGTSLICLKKEEACMTFPSLHFSLPSWYLPLTHTAVFKQLFLKNHTVPSVTVTTHCSKDMTLCINVCRGSISRREGIILPLLQA